MALVTQLVTVSGILLVTLVPRPAEADSSGSCSATGSIAGCLGDRNGTIDLSGEIRRRGRQGDQGLPGRSRGVDVEAAAATAYCADAAANQAAATTALPEIVPLCGFAPPAGGAGAPPNQSEVL